VSDATLSLLVLAGTVALFVWNRLSVGSVAVISALALYVTGLVDANTAVSGFGEPIVVFIAGLFIVSEGLDASGVTAWAGQALVRRSGRGRAPVLAGIMGLAALMGAFVTPNGSAAALLPVAVVAARRAGLLPAELLMPLAFAASAGAMLVLSGSTVNVIVSEARTDVEGVGFGFFEFGATGLPLVVLTTLVCVLLGRRLLPRRQPDETTADLSDHADTLLEHYTLEQGFYRLATPAASNLVGAEPEQVTVPEGVTLVGVQHAGGDPGLVGERVAPGDVLVVSGDSDRIAAFVERHALRVVATPLTRATREALLSRERGVAEVVVPPRSPLIGQRTFPGQVRSGLTVLTVRRLGRSRGPRATTLAEGDLLLLHGPWEAVSELARDDDVLVVDDPDLVRRQNAPLDRRAWLALGVLAVTVGLLATGVTSPAIAGLVGAGLMVLTRVVTPYQAYRAVSWQTVVLVGGLIPLSVAIRESGAADLVAGHIVDLVAGTGPRVLLAVLFVLTVVLGQVVSNTATVLIVTPIALAAGEAAGVSPAPVLMLVAVAGAASFLTPIATPANMIVMGAAGYRFGDYWKLGLAVTAVWFVVAVGLIPVIWGT
jgi:di/tricarboxylate transporter